MINVPESRVHVNLEEYSKKLQKCLCGHTPKIVLSFTLSEVHIECLCGAWIILSRIPKESNDTFLNRIINVWNDSDNGYIEYDSVLEELMGSESHLKEEVRNLSLEDHTIHAALTCYDSGMSHINKEIL